MRAAFLIFTLATAAASAEGRTVEIAIDGMQFKPAKVTVARGDTLVFKNKDLVPHTATAVNNKSFDSNLINPDKSWSYEVKLEAGKYPYVCSFHPTMKAELIVTK